jgi:hypothetical protein
MGRRRPAALYRGGRSITLSTYSHVLPPMQQQAAAAFASAMAAGSSPGR